MKKLNQVLAIVSSLMLYSVPAFTCSVSVNQLIVKNDMAVEAMNEFNININTVSKTNVSSYSHHFNGTDEYSCPLELESDAKVTINYKMNKFTTCELSVQVNRIQKIGGTPSFPLETYEFNLPASSCTTIPIRRIPIPSRADAD